MAIGASAANNILKGLCGQLNNITLAPTSYLGFLTASPSVGTGDIQSYNEPYPISTTDNGYARILIGNYQNSSGNLMGTPSAGTITNIKLIAGTECINENWTPIICFGIFSVPTGGDLLAWGYLQDANGDRATYNVTTGKIPVFRIGALQLSFELTEPVSQGA